jgi:hypothetical protein
MPRVGFEPTTPMFERAKTFHALDHADTLIGSIIKVTLRLLGSSQLANGLAR